MKKTVLIILVILLLIAGLIYSQRNVLTTFIMDRGLERRLGHSIMDDHQRWLTCRVVRGRWPDARPETLRPLRGGNRG